MWVPTSRAPEQGIAVRLMGVLHTQSGRHIQRASSTIKSIRINTRMCPGNTHNDVGRPQHRTPPITQVTQPSPVHNRNGTTTGRHDTLVRTTDCSGQRIRPGSWGMAHSTSRRGETDGTLRIYHSMQIQVTRISTHTEQKRPRPTQRNDTLCGKSRAITEHTQLCARYAGGCNRTPQRH